jgi:hypothetical protein
VINLIQTLAIYERESCLLSKATVRMSSFGRDSKSLLTLCADPSAWNNINTVRVEYHMIIKSNDFKGREFAVSSSLLFRPFFQPLNAVYRDPSPCQVKFSQLERLALVVRRNCRRAVSTFFVSANTGRGYGN